MNSTNEPATTRFTHWTLGGVTLLEIVFLVGVFLGAFTVRVWPLSKIHFWDEAVYLQDAEVICCGKTNYSDLDSRPPLLSMIFAAAFLVWHNVYAADIVTALLNAAGPVLLYFCGRRIVGRRAAAIAALLMAFLPFFVGVFPNGFDSDNTGNSLLTDEPSLTLLLLALLIMLRGLRRNRTAEFALAGFVLGLAVLMRFASLLSVGVLGLLVFASTRWFKAGLATVFGFVVALLPYLVWSRVQYGGFLTTLQRGWQYYEGARESPLFLLRNFGVMFSWVTLAGLALWVGRWIWNWRYESAGTDDRDHADQAKLVSFLWIWAGLLFVFFVALPHQEPRYAMPVGPPLFLLAGSGLTVLLDFPRLIPRIAGTAALVLGLACTFAPLRVVFGAPFIERSSSEEMQVSEFLDENLPPGTTLYSNFNYPLFAYYSHLPVHELPEAGPKLYSALQDLPRDGVLIVYTKPDIHPDPPPEWLAAHPEFQPWRQFPSIALYRYRKADAQ